MTLMEQKNFLEYSEHLECYPMFLLALNTGLRSGELRALQWQDIDFKKQELHVTGTLVYLKKGYFKDTPKTESSRRTVPLTNAMITLLKNHRKSQLEMQMLLGAKWSPRDDLPDLVFPTEFGRPMNRDRLKRAIDIAVKEVQKNVPGFERITAHTFRHTFATRCIENGMQPQVLKAILGHSKLSMTMDLYAHVLPDQKAEEIKKIENII